MLEKKTIITNACNGIYIQGQMYCLLGARNKWHGKSHLQCQVELWCAANFGCDRVQPVSVDKTRNDAIRNKYILLT